jgi:prepilin-type N-terminal cleavage/methylation domain-containing protein
MKPCQKAFTLLELLVVITIIGILASIVVVSMSGSTDSATIAKGKAYAQQVHALLGHEAVGVWNFDEGTVNTCSVTQDACDISGYNNHGTFVGDTHFVPSDIGGYALSFDGVNDSVNCGSNESLNIAGDITIAAWIKLNSVVQTEQSIVSKNTSSNAGYWLFYNHSTGNQKFGFYGVNNTRANSTISPSLDEWTHVVVIRNGTNVTFYVNGIFDVTVIIGGVVNSVSYSPLKFSTRSDGTSWPFSGLIDDVRIYAEALPATEIQKHYAQGLERLLVNQSITQSEHDQRMEEFNKSLASK